MEIRCNPRVPTGCHAPRAGARLFGELHPDTPEPKRHDAPPEFLSGKTGGPQAPGPADYRANTKGDRRRRMSLLAVLANSPKTAEPLPDIEA